MARPAEDALLEVGAFVQQVFLLSLTAAFNPTLLTATTVMLLLPNPRRLMLGFWLGGLMTSVTIGLVIVFTLKSSGVVGTARDQVSPGVDIALGVLVSILAVALWTEQDRRVAARRSRRSRRRESNDPPRWRRALDAGRARDAFVVGALLTLPGASYLAALTRLSKLDYPTATTVAVVIGFNLVMLILLEAPLVAFSIAPARTERAIARIKAWAAARGRYYASRVLAVVGVALIVRGIIELLA